MYNAKISPPASAQSHPRKTVSSSLHHSNHTAQQRQRAGHDHEQNDGADSNKAGSSTASSSSVTAALLPHNVRNSSAGYAHDGSPYSPTAKSKSSSRCGSCLDGKNAQGLYFSSLLINVVLLVLIFVSFYASSPFCLHSLSPRSSSEETGTHDFNTELVIPPLEPLASGSNQDVGAVVLTVPPVVLPTPVDEEKSATPPPVEQKPPPSPPPSTVETLPQQQPPSNPPPIIEVPSTNSKYFVNDASDHELSKEVYETTWSYCLSPTNGIPLADHHFLTSYNLTWQTYPHQHCPLHPQSEQAWQIGWYGGQVAVGVQERLFPLPQQCVHLPPTNYQWPYKYTQLPAQDQDFFHWNNLRVSKFQDLKVFNEGTPKNLYHFNATQYDLDGLEELAFASQYIPFAAKIRNFLDIGAGGASLGLIMRRKYQVETISVIFPDWPYCEYITERGGLCVLVDAMEAMPFARASFDVIHISWVYHGQKSHELVTMYKEIDRLIRPGGYIWQRGGWSLAQIYSMKHLLITLGYVPLVDKFLPKPNSNIFFGENADIPFEGEWSCIYVKPMHAVKKTGCDHEGVPEMMSPPT